MAKCTDCNKVITKRLPGIECSKCHKWRHAECTGIPPDKFDALITTECVDWVCRKCNKNPKRLSVIAPDFENEPITPITDVIDPKLQLASMVRTEVNKILKSEINDLRSSNQFFSDKIDEYEEKITAFNEIVKGLESKVLNLSNKNSNTELRCQALEQRVAELEQNKLDSTVEVAGIPKCKDENIGKLVTSISEKLGVPAHDVVASYRMNKKSHTKEEQTNNSGYKSPIVVTLKDVGRRNAWVAAGRAAGLTAADFGSDPVFSSTARLYVREALTHHMKNLLWQAKQRLKQAYRFVWCKDNKIFVRRDEREKIIIIRSISDIENLLLKCE